MNLRTHKHQAFAAILCRVVDYYHVRARAERETVIHAEASNLIKQLEQAEGNVAQAIEALDEDESGETHQVG